MEECSERSHSVTFPSEATGTGTGNCRCTTSYVILPAGYPTYLTRERYSMGALSLTLAHEVWDARQRRGDRGITGNPA